jgi:prepilin-type N-terminal cleavage/methylation domain-containing protein
LKVDVGAVVPAVPRALGANKEGVLRMQGLYGYFRRNLTGKKGQAGFTLIELLVVVTILGVLAAIVTLSLVGLTTNAQAKACQQEYKTIQAGLDAYMANNNLDAVPAADASNNYPNGTNSMTTAANGGSGPIVLYNPNSSASAPTYVRNTPTQFAYIWNSTGRITSVVAAPGGPAVPTGCQASPS